ncbi:hypothetical protein STEG23_036424, partial [Scotinomys teguina]
SRNITEEESKRMFRARDGGYGISPEYGTTLAIKNTQYPAQDWVLQHSIMDGEMGQEIHVEGLLGCFKVLDIMNNAAMNIDEHVSLWYKMISQSHFDLHFPNDNDIMKCAGKWMELEYIILSEKACIVCDLLISLQIIMFLQFSTSIVEYEK